MDKDDAQDNLTGIAVDEMAYVDRQIDSMWFMLRQVDGKPVSKESAAEWAKHTRNAYLRMARRLAAFEKRVTELVSHVPELVPYKPSHPHLWLYCKHHYKESDDKWQDMKVIVAYGCGNDVVHIGKSNVLLVLSHAAEEAIKYGNGARDLFQTIEDQLNYLVLLPRKILPEYPEHEFMMNVYRSLIALCAVQDRHGNVLIELPAPNAEVLPCLKEQDE